MISLTMVASLSIWWNGDLLNDNVLPQRFIQWGFCILKFKISYKNFFLVTLTGMINFFCNFVIAKSEVNIDVKSCLNWILTFKEIRLHKYIYWLSLDWYNYIHFWWLIIHSFVFCCHWHFVTNFSVKRK